MISKEKGIFVSEKKILNIYGPFHEIESIEN